MLEIPGGHFHIKRSGELGYGLKFGDKIRGKTWEVWYHKTQKLGQNFGKEICHNDFGVISEIQMRYLSPIFLEVKFGAMTRISEALLGPDLLIWKYSPPLCKK